MVTSNKIDIQAPLPEIFAVASDLPRWPEYLAHYRYNKYLSQMPWGGIIKMAAVREFLGFKIPVGWKSIYKIDTERTEMQFEHLVWYTKGMRVVWTFKQLDDQNVEVEIFHELELKWPLIGGLVAKYIIGEFFIEHIANKTLRGLKKRMERR